MGWGGSKNRWFQLDVSGENIQFSFDCVVSDVQQRNVRLDLRLFLRFFFTRRILRERNS